MPKECVLRLHKDLYPAVVIKKAAGDFSQFMPITVKRIQDYHVVSIACEDDARINMLKGEFLNYCLMLAKTVQ